MGVVYRAHDCETSETVAVKVLRPEIAADAAAVERFKNELRLARKITHKNVCRIHEFHRAGDTAFISMEFVEGESLRSLLDRVEGLSVRHGLKILGQILAGLAEAHAQGVIHRDLKPENIVIARDGTVKLMDFGIAHAVESTATVGGLLVGTPAYMSPEQAQGLPADARSDIYSLGLVMFEMFTGQRAYHAETTLGWIEKQVREPAPDPRSVEPDLPEYLARAMATCLAKDPARRFQAVAELEAALARRGAVDAAAELAPQVPSQLLRWTAADTVIAILAAVSLIYVALVRDRLLPASAMKLEVDVLGVRKLVTDLNAQWGRADLRDLTTMEQAGLTQSEVQLDLRRDLYRRWVANATLGDTRQGLEVSNVAGTLLVWRLGNVAMVDQRGQIESLRLPAWIPGDYRPQPPEERRAMARQILSEICRVPAQEKRWSEETGGAQSASYTASWGGASVSLLADKLERVRCTSNVFYYEQRSPLGRWYWISGTAGMALVLGVFFLHRCYRMPGWPRRLPLALFCAVAGSWMFLQALPATNNSTAWVPSFPLYAYVGSALAAWPLCLVAIVAAEHSLRRRTPERVAAWLHAVEGRFLEPGVGWATVRGVAAGLVIVAVETLWSQLTTAERFPAKGTVILTGFLDPAPVTHAIRSGWPALFALTVAIYGGVAIALVFFGLPLAFWGNRANRSLRHRLDSLALGGAPWALCGIYFYLAQVIPNNFHFALLESALLAWIVSRYDILTLAVAVATATVCVINYPLLEIFSVTGNGPQSAVFALWALLVLFGVGVTQWRRLQSARAG
jgi:hypothetical protein